MQTHTTNTLKLVSAFAGLNSLLKNALDQFTGMLQSTAEGLRRLRPIAGAGLVFTYASVAMAGDYVIVVDTSGSMNGAVSAKDGRGRIAVVDHALRDYLPALPQPSRVHLIAFNSGIVAEKEVQLDSPKALANAIAWVAELKEFARGNGQTHLWTTLRRALQVASEYSKQNPGQPVVVRVLTDGEDNEHVTSLDEVIREFPLVDGEHIRGNLVLLGDLELKTKLSLPDGAFETTKNVRWADLFPPVILNIPTQPRVGDEVRFVENTRSTYTSYEWLVDGQSAGTEKVLTWRFTEARPHFVTLKVKGLDGSLQSSVEAVAVAERTAFKVEIVAPQTSIQPGDMVRLLARTSIAATRIQWFIDGKPVGSTQDVEWQPAREGTFAIKVVAWNADNEETETARSFLVAEVPITVRIEAPEEATAGTPVQFASESTGPVAKVEWRFGDGTTSTGKDPLHTFSLSEQTDGVFPVVVRVTSPAGHVAEAGPHRIRVQALTTILPPVAAFRVIEEDPCVGDMLHLVDESQGQVDSRRWEIDGAPSSLDRNPAIHLAKPGGLAIKLTVTGPGGTHTTSREITVRLRYAPVQLKISSSAVSGVAPFRVRFANAGSGEVQSWRWDFGDGSTSTEPNPSHEFSVPKIYNVRATAIPADPTAAPVQQQLTISVAKPWPLWVKALILLGALATLATALWALMSRRQRRRLRLPVHYWPQDSVVCRRFDLTTANECKDLGPEFPLRLRRVGSSQELVAEGLTDAVLVLPDGQEVQSQNIGTGSRLVVKTAAGASKAIAISTSQKPRRPTPAQEAPAAPPPAALSATPAGSDFNWGWDSSGAK